MLRLYDSLLSGNSWKVRLMLNHLSIPFERVTLDLRKGETRSESFALKSRFQRVPVLELEDGRTLVESGAILLFLASGTKYLPNDPLLAAEVTSWLLFEQGDLQTPIARCRVHHLQGRAAVMGEEIRRLQSEGYAGLVRLDAWLQTRTWLVDEEYSVADIALYPYVALSPQGGFDLTPYAGIRSWLARVERMPGWIDLRHGAQPLPP